jgi:hypothetical protein
MTKPFNEFEVQRAAALKAYRTAIRLKHSLAADAEIAETLPEVEREIDEALNQGSALMLDPSEIFGDSL